MSVKIVRVKPTERLVFVIPAGAVVSADRVSKGVTTVNYVPGTALTILLVPDMKESKP